MGFPAWKLWEGGREFPKVEGEEEGEREAETTANKIIANGVVGKRSVLQSESINHARALSWKTKCHIPSRGPPRPQQRRDDLMGVLSPCDRTFRQPFFEPFR